jgi:hypothetical protein
MALNRRHDPAARSQDWGVRGIDVCGNIIAMSSLRTLALASMMLAATTSAPKQQRVPVRTLTTLAASRDTFGAPLNVHHLPGSRLLVNDAKSHRLLVLDSTMRVVRVILDSITGAANSYGTRPEALIPYLGDSALFVDVPSQSLIVITPDGAVGRSMAGPNDRGVWGVLASAQGVDASGGLLYRGLELRRGNYRLGINVHLVGYGYGPISSADSLPLIRADLATRRVDTVAGLRNSAAKRTAHGTDSNGQVHDTSWVNPMVAGDEWALMSDGTIAVVRGHDYHVDWIAAGGHVTSTGKLPFDWKRLTDEEKTRARDSAIVALAKADSAQLAQLRAALGGSNNMAVVSRSGGSGSADAPPAQLPARVTIVLPIDSFPDYYPALRPNAAHGDRDGNLWILPSTSAQSLAGELVYDVVSKQGELAHRVRAPLGRSIVGFGPGGIVYLLHGDLTNGFQLERARVGEAK